jgi:hypothetical protein
MPAPPSKEALAALKQQSLSRVYTRISVAATLAVNRTQTIANFLSQDNIRVKKYLSLQLRDV